MLIVLSLLALVPAALSLRHGHTPPGMTMPIAPAIAVDHSRRVVSHATGVSIPPYNTTYWFDQLVDHENPRLCTFKQRYWHTWEFYEPGARLFYHCLSVVERALRSLDGVRWPYRLVHP